MADNFNAQAASANQASQTASDYTNAATTLPDMLRQAVAMRFANNPISQERDTALKGVLTQPNDTRQYLADTVKGGTILSPTQQNAIMSSRAATASIPLISLNDIVGNLNGSVGNLVDAGTNAFKSLAGSLSDRAQLAQTSVKNAFDRYIQGGQLGLQQQTAAIKQHQLNSLQALMSALSGGGGTGTSGASTMSPEQKRQLIASGVLSGALDPASANALTSLYGIQTMAPNATSQTNSFNAQSGLQNLQTLENMIKGNPGIVGKSQIPLLGRLGDAGTYNTAANEVSDVITRLRTGAALNADEEAFYRGQLPSVTDSPETIQYKINLFRNLFSKFANPTSINSSSTPSVPDGTVPTSEWQ